MNKFDYQALAKVRACVRQTIRRYGKPKDNILSWHVQHCPSKMYALAPEDEKVMGHVSGVELLVIVRTPKGYDGTCGRHLAQKIWGPGCLFFRRIVNAIQREILVPGYGKWIHSGVENAHRYCHGPEDEFIGSTFVICDRPIPSERAYWASLRDAKGRFRHSQME